MENTNYISIPAEEYKALLSESIEKEYIDQIRTLLEKIDDMEAEFKEQRKTLEENSLYWFKRWETENKKVGELEEELSFYKPAQQEQKEAS